MKIGLYFGTFDPIHLGHATIASQVYNTQEVDEVWFVITPCSPEKQNSFITSKQDRLNMARLAVSRLEGTFKVTDVEYHLPPPQYTAVTLEYLINKHQGHSFSLIMGADNYLKLHTWHKSHFIIQNFTKYVYSRRGNSIKEIHPDTILLPGSTIDISSTIIRTGLLECKQYLDENVLKYISLKQLYNS